MEKIIRMRVAELVMDYDLYPRQQIDGYHVNEMIESLKAGATFPPIIADAKSKRIIDGFHRTRALQRLYKEKAEVDVLLKKYSSEAEMYETAMRLNSTHGRNLTSYDKAHCILKGQEFGLSREQIAGALKITTDRIAELIDERWTADKDVLKRTMAHLAGQHISEAQRDFIPRAGGLDQLFYINQVIALIESDSIDWSRQKIKEGLQRLLALLEKSR